MKSGGSLQHFDDTRLLARWGRFINVMTAEAVRLFSSALQPMVSAEQPACMNATHRLQSLKKPATHSNTVLPAHLSLWNARRHAWENKSLEEGCLRDAKSVCCGDRQRVSERVCVRVGVPKSEGARTYPTSKCRSQWQQSVIESIMRFCSGNVGRDRPMRVPQA